MRIMTANVSFAPARVTRRRTVAVLSVLAVGVAACSSVDAPASSDELSSALARIEVEDAFTAVVIRPVSDSTFPFPGSDGRYHVAYDLVLTNTANVPATVERVDVVRAGDPSKVIVSYSGTGLVDPDCPVGDCNRLRRLPSFPTDSNVIPPQESRALLVDFAFDSLRQAPKAVLHHFVGAAAVNPGSQSPAPVDYVVTPFDISDGEPRVIGPPVKGDHWIALNGCCEPGFPHRTSLASFNGQLVNGQRFAIDWKQTNEEGAFFEGDPNQNESYIDYGSNIYAVADGTVITTLDELEPNKPGILPANDPVLGPQITVQTVDGNHIIQSIGGGLFAFYAHLQKGTLLVKPGDKVKKGQIIAKLGNTGNSNAAHMHFHVMDGPSAIGSDGVPYVIDRFSYDGQVSVEAILEADDFLSGTFLDGQLPQPQPRRRELPLQLAIVNFPT